MNQPQTPDNEVATPRTDEAAEAMGLKAFVVPIEICRQLERELSEPCDLVGELCETALYYYENDEIRSQIRKQLDQLNHNSNNKPS
jgi:hypothetical protein